MERCSPATARPICPWAVAVIAIVSLMGPDATAEPLRVTGTGSPLGIVRLAGQAFSRGRPGTEIVVLPSLGSGGSLRALREGAIDLAVSAKAPDDETLAWAEVRPWARSPFVIAVQADLPVAGITTAQLAKAYSGQMTEWPDGRRLRVVLRPRDDTDTRILSVLGPGMGEAVASALDRWPNAVAITDQDGAAALETIPGAIGTLALGQILAERRALKPLSLDGVAPTLASMADGTYPHAKSFHLVTRRPAREAVSAFVEFLDSPETRSLLEVHGFQPVPARP
ncbi:MAG: substrate-binding domain-containing protein [Magnetospirillum sp. WYHS-4]